MMHPPFVEGPIWSHVEALFRWWGLRECVTDVSTIDDEVLCHGNCVEQALACLVDAISICFVKDLDGTRSSGSIADAMCLFLTIECFDAVSPDKMKDCVVLLHRDGITEHLLFVILVQLEEF